LWGVALEIALIVLIDYTPVGNELLGTAPIPASVWLFLLPWAVGMVAIEEARKFFARRRLSSQDSFP
jgi:sodium/potassium-transporting ATPase subunit alpha